MIRDDDDQLDFLLSIDAAGDGGRPSVFPAEYRGQKAIVKVYPADSSKATVEKIIEIQSWLAAYGLAPKLYSSCRDAQPPIGRMYTISEFIDGIPLSSTRRDQIDLASVGEFLGELHVALSAMDYQRTCVADPNVLKMPSEHSAEELERMIGAVDRARGDANFYMGALEYKRDLFLHYVETGFVKKMATLPTQLLHGDFHYGNVMLKKCDGKLCAIDFDMACVFPRVYELSKLFTTSVFEGTAGDEALAGLFGVLAVGYWKKAGFSPAELENIIDCFLYVNAASTFGFYQGAGNPLLEYAKNRLRGIVWLNRNREAVAEKITRAWNQMIIRRPRDG